MTVRTTSEAVAEILEVDSTLTLTPFIESASALVTEICEPVTTYDDDRLELIERWLSAWAYAIRDKRSTSESVAKSLSVTYQHAEDLGFDCNEYGQMAMRLDTNGGLAALNEQIKSGGGKVGITWLGTENDEGTDSIL